jgi:predicted secreted protein
MTTYPINNKALINFAAVTARDPARPSGHPGAPLVPFQGAVKLRQYAGALRLAREAQWSYLRVARRNSAVGAIARRESSMLVRSACGRFLSGFGRVPIAIFLLVCCSTVASAATQAVTDKDKGSTVHLKTGDVLEVRLSSNPTTGYAWYVHKQSTALLKLSGQSQTEATQPGVGRPIVQIFKFEPRDKGTGVLLLHYVRSWEKPDPNEEQFDLHVTIE